MSKFNPRRRDGFKRSIVDKNSTLSGNVTITRYETPKKDKIKKPHQSYRLDFGKFKGYDVSQVPRNYLDWVYHTFYDSPKPDLKHLIFILELYYGYKRPSVTFGDVVPIDE